MTSTTRTVVVTGGGDCPALNAAIRAVVHAAIGEAIDPIRLVEPENEAPCAARAMRISFGDAA